MKIFSAGQTDTGMRRENNEDSFLVDDELGLYVVADGIGGHAGGEVASRMAVETFREEVKQAEDREHAAGTTAAALATGIQSANAKLIETASRNPELRGMGTTLTGLLLAGSRAHLAHIGDSRAYLLRNGVLRQVSEDHTVVAEQVRSGQITAEEAKSSPYRHIITNALGIDLEPQASISEIEMSDGDTVLLCSDGLTEMIDDREIETILSQQTAEAAAKKLISAANERGGVDNITVVVLMIE